jgi:hypothetical protein
MTFQAAPLKRWRPRRQGYVKFASSAAHETTHPLCPLTPIRESPPTPVNHFTRKLCKASYQ